MAIQGILYALPVSADHTARRIHIQDNSSPECTIGYKADLLVYVHVIYNFILDLNNLICFAFCVCFTRLKSSWPVRNGFVTTNRADLLIQQADCKLGNVSALALSLEHNFSRRYKSRLLIAP